MFVFEITIDNQNFAYDSIEHDLYTFLALLESNRQVVPRDHLIVKEHNKFTVRVSCPEQDSISSKNSNEYAINFWQKIENHSQTSLVFNYIGEDIEYPLPRYALPEKSSFYLLRFGWYSPLICGDSDTPIPLYKIPYTDSNAQSYDNITMWESYYKNIYLVWLKSQFETERFMQAQLEDINSPLNKAGRELCQLIEEKTRIPTYYFLFNERYWTVQEDQIRKCPITNNEWNVSYLKTFYDFKCDQSRLISSFSSHCIDG
ncbi:MAG: hypothetical protein RLZZ422_2023 [Pseudomonadota bacterium]|jgi:predicted  nucleic acid-binding Zn ribbon protein